MLSYFWVSGIINSMLSAFPKQEKQNQAELFFTTFVSLSIFSVSAALLLFAFSDNLLAFLNKSAQQNLIGLSALYLILNGPSFINEYILYLKNKSKQLQAYAFMVSCISVLAAVAPAAMGYNLIFSVYALTAVSFLKLLYTLYLIATNGTFIFNKQLITTNIKNALPLMLAILVSGSAEYIDGIIVKSKFSDLFFAVYRYGAKELPIMLVMANTFSSAVIPVISAKLSDGLYEVKKGSSRLMHIFFPVSIALMLFSPIVYKYVFNDSFIYSSLIFNIYLLLIIPRVLFPQSILTALQQTRFLFFSSLLELTINVLLSVWLANKIGLPGVAIGTFIAYCADKVFLSIVLYKTQNIGMSAYLNIKLFGAYTTALILAFAAGQYLMSIDFWQLT